MEEIPFEQPLPVRRGDALDISWNWSRWLRRAGGSIAIFSTQVPAGITKVSEVRQGPRVILFISVSENLEVGQELELSCTVTNTLNPPRQETSPYRLVIVG